MPLSVTPPQEEPDYLELLDGTHVPFINWADMTIRHSAQWGRFVEQLKSAEKRFQKARTAAQRIAATEKRADVNRARVAFMLPTLPEDILADFTLPQLGDIINYWLRTSRDEDDEGN